MNMRTIIADDHSVVRIGLRTLLEQHGRHQVVAEARCPQELFQVLERTTADILVTDFSMPGGLLPDGYRMLRDIRRRFPDLPVVLLTSLTDDSSLCKVLQLGVKSIVNKTAGLDYVVHAVWAAHAGGTYLNESVR